MFLKKSRYKNAREFEPRPDGSDVFRGIRARAIGVATGVIEHEVQSGDRLDLLARHYYNDDRLWWRIADANPEMVYGQALHAPKKTERPTDAEGEPPPLFVGIMLSSEMEGRVILIPRDTE